MATNYILKPFRINLTDLNFLRDQVAFRPLFDAEGNAIINWDGTGTVYNDKGLAYADMGSAAANIAEYGHSYASVTAAQGLRDVTGDNNNLLLVNKHWGAVDQDFLRSVAPDFDKYIKPAAAGSSDSFYADKTFGVSTIGNTDYTSSASQPLQNVVDYTPRMISRTITTGGAEMLRDANGQVVHWDKALYEAGTDANYNALVDTVSPGGAGLINGAAIVSDPGLLAGGQHDPQDPTSNETFYGAINPGVAPSNSFLAYFGQFVDHGLDFIGKGSGVKVTIPLATDDPLYRAPGTNGPNDPGNTKITVSRADVSGYDADGQPQHLNHTSPYIDQSQTYGSHVEVTDILREWVSTDGGLTYHPGAHLLDGETSAEWTNAWGEITKATLPTLNELRAHLLATGRDDLTWGDVLDLRNRDANGHVETGAEAGNSGQALLLDMNPRFDTAHFSAATVQALADIGIVADGNGKYALGGPNSLGTIINFATFEPMSPNGSDPLNALAQEVLLESVGDHYIAGDGRNNENVALTSIHHVFHEEHNYQVRNIQEAILEQDARAVTLGDGSHSIAHDWQVDTGHGMDADGNFLTATGAISWDEVKLFDAAKLTVEMEYQHAVIDQYARTITPDIPEFVGYNSGEDATISLEYSQAAFRFGHSTMRETIDYLDPNGSITGKVMSVALEQAFLNPGLFAEKGAAAIAMGLTHQQMNEIDEILTPAMNQGLLGQPLDLGTINIARGRDVGLPTLNDFREAIGLTRYASWSDFGSHMVHPESLVNFIAAYSFDGDIAKAQAIIDAEAGDPAALAALLGLTEDDAYNYALDFLNGDATKAGADGFNHIDTWIGGLAEVHVMGGLLGETFNLVFVDQMNRLMDGDRFYYLYRLNNLNLNDEIQNGQLKDLVERNTGLEHLNGSVFAYADQYYELSRAVDPDHTTGSFKTDHAYADQLAANPTLGVFSTSGSTTFGNGAVVTVNGVQYIRDLRAENLNLPNVGDGTNLDGTPNTGANSNEVIVATDRKDLIYAMAGDDTVYGEGDDDRIYGDAGIDRLYGGSGNDYISGGDGGDLIDGGDGDDELWGDSSGTAAAGLDQIIGGEGNDTIYGGVGIDKLSGGAGDDVIFGGGDTDAFTHGGDGNDYIDGGTDGDLLWGDGGDDLIVGNDNQDIVAGLDGDDILRPGSPSSAMGGGPDEVLGGDGTSDAGNDGKGTGFDLIDFSDHAAAATGVTADFSTQQNPLVNIDGTTTFPAWVGIEGAIGSRNNDTMLADANDNWLIGGSGDDNMAGGAGNDVVIGDGIRLDSLVGTYVGPYDQVFDTATNRATGFIQANGLLDAAGPGFAKHFTEMLKSAMFKDLELGGSTIKELSVNGKAVTGSRVGDGGTAGTTDTAVFTGNRADYTARLITFTTANQGVLLALLITDKVPGRDGADLIVGVEKFEFADRTLDFSQMVNHDPVGTVNVSGYAAIGEPTAFALTATDAFTDADGIVGPVTHQWQVLVNGIWEDIPDATALTYRPQSEHIALGQQIRVVATYTDGNGNVERVASAPSEPAGRYVTGTNGSNNLTGTEGQDVILGFNGNDRLTGLGGSDYLDGGSGNDTMIGGAGGDTYVVGSNGDVVTETADNGNDTVLASISYTLGANVENLTLQGNNNLNGTGNALVNVLTGNSGNNTLNGGLDADTMIGGGGNDTYLVDNVGDVVVESAGQGSDTVLTGLADYALTDNVENLTFSGNVANTGSGNALNNMINGGAGADILNGFGGNDTFLASANDGNDSYDGGDNVDTYDLSATSANASVNLLTGLATSTQTGTDTLTGIENVTGGSGADSLTGNAANNVLRGGGGVDLLAGDAGNDTFVFGNGDSGTGANRDRIIDFVQGQDRIDLAAVDARQGGGQPGGDQAFTWGGLWNGSGSEFGPLSTPGQVKFHYEGADTVVDLHVLRTGGGQADVQIVVTGHHVLNQDDFIL